MKKSAFVEIWGSGKPLREFLYVSDMADACVYLMENYNGRQFVNIGCGEDISIKNLALLIKRIVGFEGDVKFDLTKPDGVYRKLLDVSRLFSMGWRPKVSLDVGIETVYNLAFKGCL